jgi:hypothetical protein
MEIWPLTFLNVDEVFNQAEGLWNSIQGTAGSTRQVIVDGQMVKLGITTASVLPGDTLVYKPPIAPVAGSPTFVGSLLTITAPNFHIFPANPNYDLYLGGPYYEEYFGVPPPKPPNQQYDLHSRSRRDFEKCTYFQADQFYVAVTLSNLRLATL